MFIFFRVKYLFANSGFNFISMLGKHKIKLLLLLLFSLEFIYLFSYTLQLLGDTNLVDLLCNVNDNTVNTVYNNNTTNYYNGNLVLPKKENSGLMDTATLLGTIIGGAGLGGMLTKPPIKGTVAGTLVTGGILRASKVYNDATNAKGFLGSFSNKESGNKPDITESFTNLGLDFNQTMVKAIKSLGLEPKASDLSLSLLADQHAYMHYSLFFISVALLITITSVATQIFVLFNKDTLEK